jgi:antitoxin ParD1/3/4
MITMNVSVPEDVQAFLEDQMRREGYSSAGDYVVALVRDAQRRRAKQELEAKLLEGLQGQSVEMTAEDWDSIESEACEGLAAEQIRQ